MRWGAALALALAALIGAGSAGGQSTPVRPDGLALSRMQVLASDARAPPDAASGWTWTAMPDGAAALDAAAQAGAVWYRAPFEGPPAGTAPAAWAVFLPYLYDGGELWLNGVRVASVTESSDALQVRWERPHLLPLPSNVLREGTNDLAIRAAPTPIRRLRRFPVVSVGPQAVLQTVYDTRMFWVRTTPQITVAVCLLVAGFVLFIWWRRRSETLYGLFGLAAALWGVRTLTFVIEQMPTDHWQLWRTVYLGATGGFVIVLAVFALRHAGIHRRWLERALLLYALVGPAWLALQGGAAEAVVNRYWTAGLIPIGLGIVGVSVASMLRQRTLAAAVLPVALIVAVLAGVHDYMVAWDVALLARSLPHWTNQRFFLLHHGANLLLLAMGSLLTVRFIQALGGLEDLNQTLEARVADRERHLAANFERMAALQRQHAATQERQLIMREIHDGLGSRLFTSLLRVERGDMSNPQIADALRECIGDMRLALDALTPGEEDFRVVLGNFLFRWQTQLEDVRIRSAWTIDWPEGAPPLSPQAVLQLLRIAQEALTNVLKHAQAGDVRVTLRRVGAALELEVADDGQRAQTPPHNGGRGLANMHARARQLGGTLEVKQGARGTRVVLRVPLQPTPPGDTVNTR